MSFYSYLFFSGNCREAMTRYQEIFGGTLDMMGMDDAPAEEQNTPEAQAMAGLVMHAALVLPDGGMLMASDDPSGTGAPKVGVSIYFGTEDAAQAAEVFNALADGGEVTMPLEQTFWSPLFGTVNDRFGTAWMVSVDEPGAGGSPTA